MISNYNTSFIILLFILNSLTAFVVLWIAIKLREVHLATNSRLDQLLTTSISEARAAGVEQGRADEVLRVLNDELRKNAEKEIKA